MKEDIVNMTWKTALNLIAAGIMLTGAIYAAGSHQIYHALTLAGVGILLCKK